MSKPTLVVMAAGIGSRYGGIKQIDPVGPSGEILLDYSVFDALHSGFEKVVFVIRKEIEEVFRERVDLTIRARCEIEYVIQSLEAVPEGFDVPPTRKKPWGTAQAVLLCKNVVHDPFGVINADDFYGQASFLTLKRHLSNAQDRDEIYDIGLVGYRLDHTLTEHGHVSRGVCAVSPEGYLMTIDERKRIKRFGNIVKYAKDDGTWIEIPADSTVSMNMWGFTLGIFTELRGRFPHFLQERADDIESAEYLLPDVVGELVRKNRARVRVLPTSARWLGVTYPEDKTAVRKGIQDLISRGVYPKDLWKATAG